MPTDSAGSTTSPFPFGAHAGLLNSARPVTIETGKKVEFRLMERSYASFYELGRWRKLKTMLGRSGKRIWGALGGLVAAYGFAVALQLLPAPKFASDAICFARNAFHDPAPRTQFTILISQLAGDTDGRQTNLVRDVFVGQRGVDARQTCHIVDFDAMGGSVAEAEVKASVDGRMLLEDWNADLLIWGEVKKADQELSLWFLGRGGGNTLGATSYSLTENLTLPENFEADLGTQLQAVALAQIAPATEQAGTYLVGLLTPVRAKLEHLVDDPPPWLDSEQMVHIRFSLGLAAQTIGRQSGNNEPLEAAIHEYQEVLASPARERAPVMWATAQSNLGTALQILGAREGDPKKIAQAVGAYEAALEIELREHAPLVWAGIQDNLGIAQFQLGER
jgi:hypothetical protein